MTATFCASALCQVAERNSATAVARRVCIDKNFINKDIFRVVSLYNKVIDAYERDMLKCDTNMFNVRSGNVCAIQNISIIHVNCLQRYIKRINLPPFVKNH